MDHERAQMKFFGGFVSDEHVQTLERVGQPVDRCGAESGNFGQFRQTQGFRAVGKDGQQLEPTG